MALFVGQIFLVTYLKKSMKTIAKRTEVKGTTYLVKLRIDNRTVITVRTKESLKNWKAKYPEAVEVA
jgi:hypothetical protein